MSETIIVYRRWRRRQWIFVVIPLFMASNISLLTFKSLDQATAGKIVYYAHCIIHCRLIISIIFSQKRLNKLLSLIIWSSACVMGAVFAIVLMGLVWDRFQTTPTITTVETNNYPIWNVPFPAITICNINKVYAPATKNITDKLYSSNELISFHRNVSSSCLFRLFFFFSGLKED